MNLERYLGAKSRHNAFNFGLILKVIHNLKIFVMGTMQSEVLDSLSDSVVGTDEEREWKKNEESDLKERLVISGISAN